MSQLGERPSERARAALEREKTLVLRSIKELEFDRAMGKVSAKDFDEMAGRLRARAMTLMKQLDAGGSGYREVDRARAQRAAHGGRPRSTAAAAPVAGRRRQHGATTRLARTAPPARPSTIPTRCSASDAARRSRRCPMDDAFDVSIALLYRVRPGDAARRPQAQMPDARQMSGVPLPVGDLPRRHRHRPRRPRRDGERASPASRSS